MKNGFKYRGHVTAILLAIFNIAFQLLFYREKVLQYKYVLVIIGANVLLIVACIILAIWQCSKDRVRSGGTPACSEHHAVEHIDDDRGG